MMLNLGILVSGNGSNLQAVLDAMEQGRLNACVRLVISDRPDSYALERARWAGVKTLCVDHKAFASRELFDQELVRNLREADVEWVVLAGFMRVLTSRFLKAYPGRIINLHPSLLPAFPGAHAVREALDRGVKITGCTVHLVDEGVDTGTILAQKAVAVQASDDEAKLLERLNRAEHELLVKTLCEISRW